METSPATPAATAAAFKQLRALAAAEQQQTNIARGQLEAACEELRDLSRGLRNLQSAAMAATVEALGSALAALPSTAKQRSVASRTSSVSLHQCTEQKRGVVPADDAGPRGLRRFCVWRSRS